MNLKIKKTRIIGTQIDVYSVWEGIVCRIIDSNYSVVMSFEDGWYGNIGSDRVPALPPELSIKQKVELIKKYQEENYNRAYDLIIERYPEIKDLKHKKDMGEITVYN